VPNPDTTSSAATCPVIARARNRSATWLCSVATFVPLLAASMLLSGCLVLRPPCELDDQVYYRTLAATPLSTEENPTGFLPLSTAPPLALDIDAPPPSWDLTLQETVRMGLENAKVLRDLQSNVLQRPDLAQTIHDPAIQATDPRFGMDGALAAFDAQFATRLMAYKNDRAFNNLFAGGGTFVFKQDLDNYVSEITKRTATGAAFALRHHVDYDANNAPANLFPSYFNVNIEGEFRQPLLQGGGVQFNRIAGPDATPGQVNGVVIARINNDVITARFEANVRDLISNLENGYWDLYYAYRELDAKVAARDAALRTWRIIHANVEQGRGYSKLQEVQALEQYYRFQQEALDALTGRDVPRTHTFNGSSGGTFRAVGGVQAAERKLRLWMGLPINDGTLIRPVDAPPEARIVFDWHQIMEEALATRPDLRRQQAKIQRYQAELVANRNFLLPQLDFVGRYRWRGYGHGLIGPRDSLDPFNNAFANLTSGQFQEWELGMEYSMPLGFRRGYAAVRNSQVLIARERAILEEQERQAIHDLSGAYADVDRAYTLAQVAYNRLAAAQDQYRRAEDAFFNLGGKVSLETVLDARIRLTEAETSYHRARVDYAVAVKNVHFEKGSLFEYNGATLANNDFCRGAPQNIIHKNDFGGEGPPLDYVMAKPPEQPDNQPPGESKRAETPQAARQAPLAKQPPPADQTPPDHQPPVGDKTTAIIKTSATGIPPVVEEQVLPLASLFGSQPPRKRSSGSSQVSDLATEPAPKAVRLPKVEPQEPAPPPSDSETIVTDEGSSVAPEVPPDVATDSDASDDAATPMPEAPSAPE